MVFNPERANKQIIAHTHVIHYALQNEYYEMEERENQPLRAQTNYGVIIANGWQFLKYTCRFSNGKKVVKQTIMKAVFLFSCSY